MGSAWALRISMGRERRESGVSATKCLHLVVTARHVAMPKPKVARWDDCLCPKRRSSVSSTCPAAPRAMDSHRRLGSHGGGQPSLSVPKRLGLGQHSLPGAVVPCCGHLLSAQCSVGVTTFNPHNNTVGRHQDPPVPPFYR